MKFSIIERNWLPSLMPDKESFALKKIIREFVESCGLSVEEIKEHQVKFEGENFIDDKGMLLGVVPAGQMRWKTKIEDKEIEVPEVVWNMINKKLKQMDESHSIPVKFPDSLYERFVVKGEK